MLAPGTRIGPYEVTALLGAGGMGQVYRARDVRLDRTVALKILPPQVAADPAFRERFDREARAISGLDHPHICALYDVGSDHGTDFLVMQFLDGETLAARLERGALTQDEALRHGSEIAAALAAAHREGIVHRDLKPANVMLTKSGVKLLDFGVAKLDLQGHGPTRTSPLTGHGVLVGTLQYMAPEQLEGPGADARSDIWALGAVIYEMLTGRPAFGGSSQASVIGAILHSVPAPVSSSQALTPPAVDRLVAKCLAKDPEARWQSAHDVGDELRWLAGVHQRSATTGAAGPIGAPIDRIAAGGGAGWSKWALAASLVLMLASLGLAAWAWWRTSGASGSPYYLGLSLPAGTDLLRGFALSPDGRSMAFVARQGETHILSIRGLDAFEARPIPGSEGAQQPFWSPDSRYVGFFANGKLRRVSVAGGAPQILADSQEARGASWGSDNVIVFAPGFANGLFRVSADGGEARPLTTLGSAEVSHRWPHFLPDGRHFLYLVRRTQGGRTEGAVYIGSLDGGEPSKLLAVDSGVVFAPEGYLLFEQGGMLVAQPFSASARTLTGDLFVVSDAVQRVADAGPTAMSLFSAGGGLLIYSTNETVLNELAWFDRSGKRVNTLGTSAEYSEMWLSPDQQDAVVLRDGDLWTINFTRGTSSRFTFDSGAEVSPVWSPDGHWIVYTTAQSGALALKAASGGAPSEELLKFANTELYPDDWTRSGHIVFERIETGRQADVWALPAPARRADGTLQPAGKPIAVLTSGFNEAHAQVSPDGKWIAYASDESGRSEIYVQSFLSGTGKWVVSTDGGDQPAWRRDGRELYYVDPDRRLVAVDVRTTPTFQIGAATILFQTAMPTSGLTGTRNNYVARADGQRFLISTLSGQVATTPLHVIVNWPGRHRR